MSSPGDQGSQRTIGRLLGLVLSVISVSTLASGLLLIAFHRRLSGDPDMQTVLLEVGVTLASFGLTSVLIAFLATKQLENRMLSRVGGYMDLHRISVEDQMDKAIGSMDEAISSFGNTMNRFVPLFGNCNRLGLEDVFLTRADALAKFGEHITAELKQAAMEQAHPQPLARFGAGESGEPAAQATKPRLWIVGSSMKGILDTAEEGFDGAGTLAWAAHLASHDLLDLRILLTHPAYADYRAEQEARHHQAIPGEIREALRFLQLNGVPADRIKMAVATPTVFAIATRDRMLLNPYPYGAEAFRSFTLTVRRVNPRGNEDHPALHRDIFEQYENRHFEQPWLKARELSDSFEVPPISDRGEVTMT